MRRLLPFTLVLLSCVTLGSAAWASTGRKAQLSLAKLTLQRLWTQSIQPNADSAPVYLGHVALPDGRQRAMIFVLAANNTANCSSGNPVRKAVLYALDAQTGHLRWSRASTGPSRCSTAAPAAAGQWVYAPGLDGKVHRYNAGSGKEYRSQGWPQSVTLMPDVEKVSASLKIAGSYLYVTTAGFIGDQGHYQGHAVTINLRTGKSKVFNSLCSNVHQLLGPTPGRANYCGAERSGFFGRGQGVTDPVTHDVYIVSGNGAWNGRTNWGDSVLKLDPSGNRLLDSFTPTNQADLDAQDLDLGSTGPALLPQITQGGHTYHLLVQGGKGPACGSCSGVALRLLNRDNLSNQGGPGHTGGDLFDAQAPGGCEVLTAPAVWQSASHEAWVYYANGCGTAGYRVSSAGNGKFRLDRVWANSRGGSTPVVKNGVVYVAGSGQLAAYSAATGAVLATQATGAIHWEYPLVVDHRVYLTDQGGHVTAWAIS